MGRSRRNRNKHGRNPAVAPPLPPAPAPAPSPTTGGAPDQPDDPAYELSEEIRQGDQETLDINIALREDFKQSKVYLKDFEQRKELITGEELKENYAKKWVKGTGGAMEWLIQDIEDLEMQIGLRGGKAMPRPPEIHRFITLLKRII